MANINFRRGGHFQLPFMDNYFNSSMGDLGDSEGPCRPAVRQLSSAKLIILYAYSYIKMKPIPLLLLLRKFSKSFRISHVSSRRLLLLLAIWKEKVTKFTENILSLDPFQILLTCLHMNCTLGVVPYRFDRTEKRLCPQEGWKWLV